jgi:hypothetical protein
VPSELMTYYYYSKSAGIFIDAAGNDTYLVVDDTLTIRSEKMANDATWWSPDKDDPNFGHNNFGFGIDTPEGHIPELEIFEKKD